MPRAGTGHTERQDRISPVLASLLWLAVSFRIDFKILLVTFKALYISAPSYIPCEASDPRAGLCWLFQSPSSGAPWPRL